MGPRTLAQSGEPSDTGSVRMMKCRTEQLQNIIWCFAEFPNVKIWEFAVRTGGRRFGSWADPMPTDATRVSKLLSPTALNPIARGGGAERRRARPIVASAESLVEKRLRNAASAWGGPVMAGATSFNSCDMTGRGKLPFFCAVAPRRSSRLINIPLPPFSRSTSLFLILDSSAFSSP